MNSQSQWQKSETYDEIQKNMIPGSILFFIHLQKLLTYFVLNLKYCFVIRGYFFKNEILIQRIQNIT